MKRTGLLLGTVLVASTAAFAGQNLTPTNYGEMEPVVFNHTAHAGRADCSSCHHTKSQEHRCGYCHKAEATGDVPSLEDAAHREGAGKCWACHLKEKAKRVLDCEDCHSG
ncbi:MAG TPA: cytochrome c3 family protein [Deferrisomatales bacterium]|nr:cytochrome c3 family protein [Deferrisomatales bacterium]